VWAGPAGPRFCRLQRLQLIEREGHREGGREEGRKGGREGDLEAVDRGRVVDEVGGVVGGGVGVVYVGGLVLRG
jgi:hypothetical protein